MKNHELHMQTKTSQATTNNLWFQEQSLFIDFLMQVGRAGEDPVTCIMESGSVSQLRHNWISGIAWNCL